MKSKLLNAGLLACALLITLSGCSSDETLIGDSRTAVQSMKISVSDGMFTSVDNNGAKTRATDDVTGTTFSNGDAIGIFVVKSDGKLALTNAKYTYDGTSWVNSDNTDLLSYYVGAKYFAYYPYQANLASDKYDATQTTAEAFFAPLIIGWTPAADQSTQDKYTAQDLMVSMATVNASTHAGAFAMFHQMSMVEMDFPQYHYTYGGSDTYRFTFDAASKSFNVAAGKYRLLVNPSVAFSVTGKNQYSSTDATKKKGWKISGTTPASAKYKIYTYKGVSAFLSETQRDFCLGTANVGDYLYSDGTTGTTTVGKTIVGIVFSNEISTAEYNAGYTHGYALALTDVSVNGPTWGPTHDAGLTKLTTFVGYYNDISAGYYGTFTKGYDKSNSTYPAWQLANNYNVDVSGFTNSGWYLPSIGQWWDVAANLGKVDLTSQQTISGDGYLYNGSTATNNIKYAITAAGGTALNSDYYCSASEYNTGNYMIVCFYSSYVDVSHARKYSTGYCVRAVLAF
ncbi:fimbrillin family protein [Segatella paludivivens]|uniref:fimbrillin family protein n=1 Tax=Segatella paludivivens TaxID=185294 RepID=UPI0003A85641|nr:fimbrillin family protein [Segatella paludivivens]